MKRNNIKLEELVIHLLNPTAYEHLSVLPHPYILLNVPNSCTLQQLKYRISGMTGVEPSEMTLIFGGTVLNDSKIQIPQDCFEVEEAVDEDTTIFRPRIILKITPPPVKVTNEYTDNVGGGSSTGLLGEDGFDGQDMSLKEEEGAPPDAGDVDEDRSPYYFDLRKELEQINCVEHFEFLQRQGFTDEGSFSHLANEDFLYNGVHCIPKRASQRILELAATIREGIEKREKAQASLHPSLALVQARLRPKNARTGSGINKPHNTALQEKIDVIRNTARRLSDFEAPPVKTKSSAKLIKKLYQQSVSDILPILQQNLLSAGNNGAKYCCEKHCAELIGKQEDRFFEFTRRNRLDLEVLFAQLPSWHSAYADKQSMIAIANRVLSNCNLHLHEKQLEVIVESCTCDLIQQQERLMLVQPEEHKGSDKRSSILPVVWYDQIVFVDKLCILIEAMERNGGVFNPDLLSSLIT